MSTYRAHLRSMNLVLAEDYIRQHSLHVFTAIEELTQAAPVALAIAQLHQAIRRSPARHFWPVIRKTKGVLLVRSAGTGQECPWPWRRTNSGHLRYELPGYLLFFAVAPKLSSSAVESHHRASANDRSYQSSGKRAWFVGHYPS
jgi:hypothetical protein